MPSSVPGWNNLNESCTRPNFDIGTQLTTEHLGVEGQGTILIGNRNGDTLYSRRHSHTDQMRGRPRIHRPVEQVPRRAV